MTQSLEDQVRADIDAIEEAYEFMLAYAAQGAIGDEAGGAGSQIRQALTRCHDAAEQLPTHLRALVAANAPDANWRL